MKKKLSVLTLLVALLFLSSLLTGCPIPPPPSSKRPRVVRPVPHGGPVPHRVPMPGRRP